MVQNVFRKHFKGCLLQRVVHYNLVTVKLGMFLFFLIIIIIKSRVFDLNKPLVGSKCMREPAILRRQQVKPKVI